ncbi:MAG: hypothetical protein JWN41_84, partial [Thermoleophilia bacterium]|nr:hypothetical protein [Thermoleophilia bacterium]
KLTGSIDEIRFSPQALDAATILGYYNTRLPHLQLLGDTGVGSGDGTSLGADCTTRCADSIYAGNSAILRSGARYYQSTRYNTKNNAYWTDWSTNDWLETDSVTTISVTAGSAINLGTLAVGQDNFASSTIQVTCNDQGGYQLFAHDASNTVGMTGAPSGTIPDMQSYLSAPVLWTANSPLGLGITIRDATGGRLAKWGLTGPYAENNTTDNKYPGLGIPDILLHERTTYSTATDNITLTTRLNAPTNTPANTYTTTIQITALPSP